MKMRIVDRSQDGKMAASRSSLRELRFAGAQAERVRAQASYWRVLDGSPNGLAE